MKGIHILGDERYGTVYRIAEGYRQPAKVGDGTV